ncbi:MAG: hypothetical protein AAGG07_12300 [Planctomycetota bacterium]
MYQSHWLPLSLQGADLVAQVYKLAPQGSCPFSAERRALAERLARSTVESAFLVHTKEAIRRMSHRPSDAVVTVYSQLAGLPASVGFAIDDAAVEHVWLLKHSRRTPLLQERSTVDPGAVLGENESEELA